MKDDLIKAIRADKRGVNKLARAAGVPRHTIYRLLNGENVGVDAADALATTLGLTLRPMRKWEVDWAKERHRRIHSAIIAGDKLPSHVIRLDEVTDELNRD